MENAWIGESTGQSARAALRPRPFVLPLRVSTWINDQGSLRGL
ncbi:hypothetical protein J2R99_001897 [Rhodopseudomonas julia]|uniref:Uncharacterized protein n=1 Tax=Rhodopseudomonas julia TaxID=200617 RepID=A0ABU0C676_9BRAD|nr:hypothetical protein [Rhodopseudomonas julia]MDQ0326028.1 hypothetical protein [Rhodopseudomonas julia]